MIKYEKSPDGTQVRARIVEPRDHEQIEAEIMRRIADRVAEYVTPSLCESARIFIAYLAGVTYPCKAFPKLSDQERRTLNLWLSGRATGISSESWHVVQFWAEMVQDAARFAGERFEMLDAATIKQRRNQIKLVSESGDVASVSTAHPAPTLRRVV